jgi:hypothetical protein
VGRKEEVMAGSLSWSRIIHRIADLDPEGLLSTAVRRTGLDDFGDPPCEEALRILVHSCNSEADLNLLGRFAARQHFLDLLTTRLRLRNFWRHTPEIPRQTIREPIFITGMPRSGTTFLHDLFAQDYDNRVPRTWEVMFPFPPPVRERFDSDPRIAKAENRLRLLRWTHPSIMKAHPVGARLPQECIAITSYSLISDEFLEMFRLPSYEKWLRTRDMVPVYKFHRSFLGHLQWRCSATRWVLKAPDHVHSLKSLMEVYPDARIVFVHRDPLKVVGSVASLTAMLRGAFSHHADPRVLGTDEARNLAEKAVKMIEFRDSHQHLNDRFIDVRYVDIVRDPVGTVRNIYESFGLALPAESGARIRDFVTAVRNKKRPRHIYRLTDFGLDLLPEDASFVLYRKRFALERELL